MAPGVVTDLTVPVPVTAHKAVTAAREITVIIMVIRAMALIPVMAMHRMGALVTK